MCQQKGLKGNKHTISIILRRGEIDGFIINGNLHSKQNIYVLADKWLGNAKSISYEELLKLVARKYFPSYYPTTFDSFSL